MTAVLSLQQELVQEDPVLAALILEVVGRPSSLAISLKELTRELSEYCGGVRFERCLSALLEQGLTEPVYTSGYEVGLKEPKAKGPGPPSLA